MSGKVRYGEQKDVKLAMRKADSARSRARLHEVACSRREVRSYECGDCDGWHLTSQQNRPSRLIPMGNLATHVPSPAAQAMRSMVAATGLMVGAAA
jgi:hypothetical protein